MIAVVAGRWEGLENLGEDALMALVPAVGATMHRVGMFASNEVKKTLAGRRTGRTYMIGKKFNIAHVAAAPGEPPAVLHGVLRRSIQWAFKWVGLIAEVSVFTKVKYARRQEFGGVHTTRKTVRIKGANGWFTVKAGTVIRTPPHPFMEPTMLRIEPEVQRMFENFDVGGVQVNLSPLLSFRGET